MGGAYWTINTIFALNVPIQKQDQNKDSSFEGNTCHDSHITSSLYVVLVIVLFKNLD